MTTTAPLTVVRELPPLPPELPPGYVRTQPPTPPAPPWWTRLYGPTGCGDPLGEEREQ